MWRNYWTVAVRALAKSKTYSIINIAGLAIGMAACIMILLYIRYEQSYDNGSRTSRTPTSSRPGTRIRRTASRCSCRCPPMSPRTAIKKDFPQVERAVYALGSGPVFLKDGQASPTKDYLITDDDFLKVVNLPLLSGTTLPAPQTAVITQSEAIKRYRHRPGRRPHAHRHFERRQARLQDHRRDQGRSEEFEPEDQRDPAHRLQQLLRASSPQFLTCWGCQSGWVYLKLRPGTDVNADCEAQMPAWEKRNIPDQPNGGIRFNQGDDQDWHFVNLQRRPPRQGAGRRHDAGQRPPHRSRPSRSSPC